jgi:small basic protein
MGITYLGDRLSIDLYLAVIVVFMIRIFTNIATIRYSFLTRFLGEKRVQEEIEGEK